MTFRNRMDAGQKLAIALDRYRGQDVVVLALPRGGVPVAAEVAAYLQAPLEILFVRKIGLPAQPEVAMGALVDGDDPIVVRNPDVIRFEQVPDAVFEEARGKALAEIDRRRELYGRDDRSAGIRDRIAIIVDDGMATGATMRAAILGVKQRGAKKIVAAIPVASQSAVSDMPEALDEVVCLKQPFAFDAVSAHYTDFRQVCDDEVVRQLAEARTALGEANAYAGKDVDYAIR